MDIKDYITASGIFVSSILIITGWIFNRAKDREHERFKTQLSRRESLVKAFWAVDDILLQTQGNIQESPVFTEKWLHLVNTMKMYGTLVENRDLETFAESFFGSENSVALANETRNRLRNNLINSIRKEIGLEPLK